MTKESIINGEVPTLSPASPEVEQGLRDYLSEMREAHYTVAVRASAGLVYSKRHREQGYRDPIYSRLDQVVNFGKSVVDILLRKE